MTSTATCTVQAFDTYATSTPPAFAFSSPSSFSLSARQSLQSANSRETTPNHARPDSASKRRTLKRSVYSRDALTMASEADRRSEEVSESSVWGSSVTQSTWLKRLSTFSSNEDSSPSSSSRPASAAVSQSNHSIPFSNAGSTTPMFPTHNATPPPLPNKLVKRNSSVRSTRSNSKLPIPTFRRPATSHQRDATMQEQQKTEPFLMPDTPDPQKERKWTNYFTPKIAAEPSVSTWRRNSTSIPNPIRRVYPDRKYRPLLLSGAEAVMPAGVEVDEEFDEQAIPNVLPKRAPSSSMRVATRFFSSPLPRRPQTSSSSFDIPRPDSRRSSDNARLPSWLPPGDSAEGKNEPNHFSSPVLSSQASFSPKLPTTAELPKWKRPPKTRVPQGKYQRKGGRSVSGPELTMGNSLGITSEETDRPTKRREVMPTQARRSSTKSRKSDTLSPRPAASPLHEVQLNLSSPTGRTATLQAFNPQSFETKKEQYMENNIPFPDIQTYPLPNPEAELSRSARQSATFSELASTLAESDNETRYRDEDSLDSPGDTLYDSVRTRATSASSGAWAPTLDKPFSALRKPQVEPNSTSLEHLFQRPQFGKEQFDRPRHSVIEEEESISTPVRSFHNVSAKASPETFRFGSSPQHGISSSPPEVPSIFRRKPSQSMDHNEVGEDESWNFGEDDESYNGAFKPLALQNRFSHLSSTTDRLSPFGKSHGSSSLTTTPSKGGIMAGNDKDARSSIFDWSEQQPLDKSPGNHSPQRPRTVHGKKDAENRGSRSVGRRAPSALHARSQSVPVVPEAESKRSQVVTNKFGTWGVGSKGVTEDWNEDFDFEEAPPLPTIPQAVLDQKRLDSGVGMFVPKSIREQQNNVLANIGLLRDWGLLIEELKELRVRAVQLSLIGKQGPIWDEVDAMIDLADQESNDHTLAPRQSPPSSPTFDYDAFDEPFGPLPTHASPLQKRDLPVEDVWDSPSPSPVRKGLGGEETPTTPRRPRKDSEAVARSVIEALQQRRNISDPTHGVADVPAKKVPFDTATLKRIVPYVQDLRDKIKKSIREIEGLYTSPRSREPPSEDPSFSRMFHDPPDSPSSRRTARRSMATTDHILSEDHSSRSPPDELTGRFKMMTVV